MKLPRFLFTLFLVLVCLLLCRSASAGGGDEWRAIDPAELAMKTSVVEKDADAEALFWEVRVDDAGETDLVFNNYIRIKIFTERGRGSQSKVDIIPFRVNARITDVSGRTIKTDGSIIELKKEDVFEKTVAKANGLKFKTKTFAMPGAEPGAIIEYRWREVYPDSSANYKRLYFQRDIPVESIKYFIKPSSNIIGAEALRFEPFAMDTPHFVKEKNGFYSATFTNVPAYHEEPRMPPEDEVRRWMLLYYSGEAKPDPDKYWKEKGKQIYESTKGLMKPNDEIKQKATALTADTATTEDKLARLYDFCRTQIKNLSGDASGLSPEERAKVKSNKSAAETLKRGQGTDGDINFLFGALASAAGFDARVALMGDRGDTFFKTRFANTYFLDLAAIAVKDGDKWLFYDPSEMYLPAGMLSWRGEWGQALISDPKEPVWANTPLSSPDKSLEKRTAKLKLSEDGTLEGDAQIEYTGHIGASKKEYNDDDSPAQREDTLRNMVKAQMSTAEVSDIKIENVQDPTKPFTYSYHVRVPGYAQRTGKRLFIQPAFFERGRTSVFTATDRRYPIYFSYPWSEQDDLEIALPAGFALDSADAPAPITPEMTQNICAQDIKISINKDTRTLHYHRTFFFGGHDSILFPVTGYVGLKQLFDIVQKSDDHTITLKQVTAASN